MLAATCAGTSSPAGSALYNAVAAAAGRSARWPPAVPALAREAWVGAGGPALVPRVRAGRARRRGGRPVAVGRGRAPTDRCPTGSAGGALGPSRPWCCGSPGSSRSTPSAAGSWCRLHRLLVARRFDASARDARRGLLRRRGAADRVVPRRPRLAERFGLLPRWCSPTCRPTCCWPRVAFAPDASRSRSGCCSPGSRCRRWTCPPGRPTSWRSSTPAERTAAAAYDEHRPLRDPARSAPVLAGAVAVDGARRCRSSSPGHQERLRPRALALVPHASRSPSKRGVR